jgi:tetratricopeptide (TPR) repeat protein
MMNTTAQPYKTLVLGILQQGHADEVAFLQGLTEAERNAIGTPELWSAKDHLAHGIFWRRNLMEEITSTLQNRELPPSEASEQDRNTRVFEASRFRSFEEVHTESEQSFGELIALVEQLSEEDLTTPNRFPWIGDELPLYGPLLGNCYEHDQEHLVQYYLDRHDFSRAIHMRETCANRVLGAEVPDWVKGFFVYNLACFYAQLNPLPKAAAHLQKAITLNPSLKEWAANDSQLAALHDQSG